MCKCVRACAWVCGCVGVFWKIEIVDVFDRKIVCKSTECLYLVCDNGEQRYRRKRVKRERETRERETETYCFFAVISDG